MIKIEVAVKKKSLKVPIIIAVCVMMLITVTVSAFIIIQKNALSRALKDMDITDEASVVRVMKYAGNDSKQVLSIASKYLDAEMKADCIRLCIYAALYLDAKEDASALAARAGAQEWLVSQLRSGEIDRSEFEVITQSGYDGYGIADGIYAEFLGGYAKAKISAIIPLDIYAYESGAYFLDSTDRLIKSISRDGGKIEVIVNTRAQEFVYSGRQIYYIDESGIPHGKKAAVLSAGEFAAGLHLEGEDVKCTVYSSEYEALRVITIE